MGIYYILSIIHTALYRLLDLFNKKYLLTQFRGILLTLFTFLSFLSLYFSTVIILYAHKNQEFLLQEYLKVIM